MIPIEVKYKEKIDRSDCRHLETFLKEYPKAKKGYVVCTADRAYQITEQITAIPWFQLESIFSSTWSRADLIKIHQTCQ